MKRNYLKIINISSICALCGADIIFLSMKYSESIWTPVFNNIWSILWGITFCILFGTTFWIVEKNMVGKADGMVVVEQKKGKK